MIKTDRLENLFTRWETHNTEYRKGFVKDGIINERVWEKDSPKILFITKEPNQRNHQQTADFREEWAQGDHTYIFAKRIAEWTFGIYHGFSKPYMDIHNNPNEYNRYLLKTAILNIKKSGGGALADNNLIAEYYKKDKPLIEEQIAIIDPHIILLCLSWNNAISKDLFAGTTWHNTGYNIFMGAWKGKRIIDFYHPSSRTPPTASFSLLKDIFLSPAFQSL